jgi:hypothetical protein
MARRLKLAPAVPMMLAVRTLSLFSGLVHVGLVSVGAFAMWLYAVAPVENQSPEQAAADDWLFVTAAPMAGLAIGAGGAIIARNLKLAATALAAEFGLGAVVWTYVLDAVDQSDGRLKLWVLAIAVTGTVAATAAYAEPR